jgi:hypothetical protein
MRLFTRAGSAASLMAHKVMTACNDDRTLGDPHAVRGFHFENDSGAFMVEAAATAGIFFCLLAFFAWILFFVFEQSELQYSIDGVVRSAAISGFGAVTDPTEQTTQIKNSIVDATGNLVGVDGQLMQVVMTSCFPDPNVVNNCAVSGAWVQGAGGVGDWLKVDVTLNRELPLGFLHITIPFKTGVLVRNEPRI